MNKEKFQKKLLVLAVICSLVSLNLPAGFVMAEEASSTEDVVLPLEEDEGAQENSGNSTGEPEGDTQTQESSTSTEISTEGQETGGEQLEELLEEENDEEDEGAQENSGNSTGEPEPEQTESTETTTTESSSTTTEPEIIPDNASATSSESTSSQETLGLGEEAEGTGCEGEDCSTDLVEGNEAVVENDIEAESNTGENSASNGGDGDALIFTGNAGLVVGVMNTANSNIIDSDFSQFLFNLFGNTGGDLNLADQLNLQNNGTADGNTSFNVVEGNKGDIDNTLIINVSTGANAVTTDNGLAIINTGDASVVADVFNILNSNVISSNWTKFIINVFDDWVGDLILPGGAVMQAFSEQNSSGCGGGACGSQTADSNEGGIHNEVSVTVDTGQNSIITRDGEGYIFTGTAAADTEISNIMNSNIQGGNWFFMAVNNYGEWNGNIFSLPPGFEIADTVKGIEVYNVDPAELTQGPSGNEAVNVVENNSGFIENSVMVNVSTGANTAQTEGGTAVINTGSASALIDIMNILNSNVSGANWLSGVINIFGSWQGNLAFGRPDLWIGESAVMSNNPLEPGKTITYTLTYRNNGDADATGVVLEDDFNERFLSVNDSGGGVLLNNPGEIKWELGVVPAGHMGSVSYTATVSDNIPGGYSQISNQAEIVSLEEDWNDGDNRDGLSVTAYKFVTPFWFLPKLELKKEINVEGPVEAPADVDYKLTLVNNSDGTANSVIVVDNLMNEWGEIVNTYSWDLGVVFPREQIVIEYTVAIGPDVAPGVYVNEAEASGFGQKGNKVVSGIAFSVLEVAGERIIGETSTSTDQVQEEPSLDDIKDQISAIKDQIKVIRQEVERILPKTEPQQETVVLGQENNTGNGLGDIILEENGFFATPFEESVYFASLGGLTTENQTSGNSILLAAASQFLSHSSAKYILSALGVALWLLVVFLSFIKAYEEAESQETK